jgi:ubiquinone/menaquinone biosynthesis C-methylase UbiE
MSKAWDHVFSALYDPLLWIGERAGMARRRADLLEQASARVLELGAGTGLNLQHYPEGIDELVLTEPSAPMASRLERRAARAPAACRVVRATAESLPFEDDSFDTVSPRSSSVRLMTRVAQSTRSRGSCGPVAGCFSSSTSAPGRHG